VGRKVVRKSRFAVKRFDAQRLASTSSISRFLMSACTAAPLFVFAAAGTAINAKPPAQLEAMMARAVQRYPSVLAAQAEARSAQEGVESAKWQRFPTLSWQTEGNDDSGQAASTLRLQQPLWTAGKITAQIEQAGFSTAAAKAHTLDVQTQTALRVLEAWQNSLNTGGKIHVFDQTLALLTRFEGLMQRRVAAQVSPSIDLEQLNARLLQSRSDVKSLQASQRIAHARLEQLTGAPLAEVAGSGASDLDQLEALSDALVKNSTALASISSQDHKAAAAQNAIVRKAEQEALAARAQLAVVKAEAWPQLYARWQKEYGRDNPDPAHVFVGLQYTLGSGLANRSQAKAAAYRAESLEMARESALSEVAESLQADQEDISNAIARAPLLHASIQTAQAVLESYERQFVAGRRGWLDVLNAAREVHQARLSAVENRVGLLGASVRWQLRMGQMAWQQD
jgi:outer membrane protein, adhesin transport system